ncbi:MAG: anaerobic sulfite reductase subunit AsrA [Parasporobacterium sp.]|nr:anaerobic sulfite reductase subunit AsrA [Parasporobacterium sp.]
MGYFVNYETMDEILETMREKYRVFAPVLLKKRNRGENKEEVRYSEIRKSRDIVYDRKSDFSPKMTVYPIIQTLLYFTGSEVRESELADDRDIVVMLRACDINGFARLDNMFLGNGNNPDHYYKRLRDRVKFILMECRESFETCFCVSMGTNRAEYDNAVRFTEEGMTFTIGDDALSGYFEGRQETEFTPGFVEENIRKVRVPDITDRSVIKAINESDFWRQFDEKCIACGGCNTVCPTCSCFDTVDVIYNETDTDGERRRSWSSCMLESYTVMAGGHGVRSKHGDNMRFKVMHKMYDYNLRFGQGHMCVGCGRCDMRCPQDIHFTEAVNGLADIVDQMKEEGRNE